MRSPLLAGLCVSAMSAAAAVDLRFTVEEPAGVARADWPATSGVPLARGALRDGAGLQLLDDAGRSMPLQTDVLARWPDGSVRWLLLDFQTSLKAGGKRHFRLCDAPADASPAPGSPLRVTTAGGDTSIFTGPLQLRLHRTAFDPLGDVGLDRNNDGRFDPNERVTRPADGLFVRDARQRRFTAAGAPAEIVVEETGPLRACVRVTGSHAGPDGTCFRYVFRLHAFRGQPFVRCSYTFINDRQDAVMTSIRELGIDLRLAAATAPAAATLLGGHPPGAGRIFQADENRYELDGQAAGRRAAGWATVAGREAGFAVGVREFWQQWPKSLKARGDTVTLGLCPALPERFYDGHPLTEESKLFYALRGGVHTFKVGVAKTHEFWVRFFTGPPPTSLAEFFKAAEEPLLATCEPAYVSATRAAGEFPPADTSKFAGYDRWLDRALADHLQRRDRNREYGLLNWGDWHGEREVNWGNLEYDLQSGLLLQYLRSGDRRCFLRGSQAARHHLDVDVVHAVNGLLKNPIGAPPKVGEIWLHGVGHTGGYYENAALPVEQVYQTGHSSNFGHFWITGDLLYYHLTGDRRAREVALRCADTMASAMTAKVGTHIRTLGWPMILVLSAYEATGDPKYLAAATRNWEALRQSLDPRRGWVVKLASDHCLHPPGSTRNERDTVYRDQRCEGNVPFMEGLTLCALARYHRHTGDPAVLRAIGTGIDQMTRECWQEDVKTFRYTACPLSNTSPCGLFMLAAEAIAYEARLTGNREHLRILREGFRSAVTKDGAGGFGKGLGQMTFFAPFALGALE